LGRGEDGNWIDIVVEWADKISAAKAGAAFFQEPSVHRSAPRSDKESVKMARHALAAAA
jgi:hypothetical protein